MVVGQNLTVNITPDSGYAVDTITVDNNEYKNIAGATSPNGEGYTSNSFKSVKFEKVTAGHTISITFAPVTGDDEIPDTYNRTLTYDANGGKFRGCRYQGYNRTGGKRVLQLVQFPGEGGCADTREGEWYCGLVPWMADRG